jgi:predicted alpha/beta-fold hydrolase
VAEAEGSSCLFLEMPTSGGHLGFIDLVRGIEPWFERRVVEFLQPRMDPPPLRYGATGRE